MRAGTFGEGKKAAAVAGLVLELAAAGPVAVVAVSSVGALQDGYAPDARVDRRKVTDLRVERIRLAWEYTREEADVHKHRFLQLFATFLSIGLAACASVLLDKVDPLPGLPFAATMFGAAGYAHYRLVILPRWLRQSAEAAISGIEGLIRKEER